MEFENWKISSDSSIVGTIQTKANSWTSITIPAYSIDVVYVKDSPLPRIVNTSLIVVGTVVTVAALVKDIYFIINYDGFNVSGGR